MEYIKKEIYVNIDNKNIVQYEYLSNTNKICGKFIRVSDNHFQSDLEEHPGRFGKERLKLATPEEKHWLLECIKLDKFITFEEAMKTFITEYYEYINSSDTSWKLGKIYKLNENERLSFESGKVCTFKYHTNTSYFKPSTKEAYDAQFVVKEPEFVLPEKWCIIVNNETRPYIKKYRESINYQPYEIENYEYQTQDCGHNKILNIELSLEQFKKYVLKEETIIKEKVIEPLPQFKVIETIETITKVENNEGNQFFIGDVVKSNLNHTHKITSFEYNAEKTEIFAINEYEVPFNINDIEHYIEPKVKESEFILPEKWCIKSNNEEELLTVLKFKPIVDCEDSTGLSFYRHFPTLNNDCTCYRTIQNGYTEITFDQFKKYVLKEKELSPIQLANIEHPELAIVKETLLEKAKRLYPIGTRFNASRGNGSQYEVLTTSEFRQNNDGSICIQNNGNGTIYFDNKWAEVIEYPHGFKIGDKIQIRPTRGQNIYTIINIEGNVLFYKKQDNTTTIQCRVLANNAIKIN